MDKRVLIALRLLLIFWTAAYFSMTLTGIIAEVWGEAGLRNLGVSQGLGTCLYLLVVLAAGRGATPVSQQASWPYGLLFSAQLLLLLCVQALPSDTLSLMSYQVVLVDATIGMLPLTMYMLMGVVAVCSMASINLECTRALALGTTLYPRLRLFGSLGFAGAAYVNSWTAATASCTFGNSMPWLEVSVCLPLAMLWLPSPTADQKSTSCSLDRSSMKSLWLWSMCGCALLQGICMRPYEIFGVDHLNHQPGTTTWMVLLIAIECLLLISKINHPSMIVLGPALWAFAYLAFQSSTSLSLTAAMIMIACNCPVQITLQCWLSAKLPPNSDKVFYQSLLTAFSSIGGVLMSFIVNTFFPATISVWAVSTYLCFSIVPVSLVCVFVANRRSKAGIAE